jgi:hypothetical protein
MNPRYYRGTPVSLLRALYLCAIAACRPSRLAAENEADLKILLPTLEGAVPEPNAPVVFRAFWSSLAAVAGSMAAGFAFGHWSPRLFGCASSNTTVLLGSIGAGVLLWGTLFVRGWQIQSWKGVSLVERVNQWLYRGLYCTGTAVVVWSVSWAACKT